MKPFNLENALRGDPVVTRNGRSVRLDPKVLGDTLLRGTVEGGVKCYFGLDGNCGENKECDLFMADSNMSVNLKSMVTPRTARKHSHYHKDVSRLSTVDIYEVCELFNVDDPSGVTQHAIKKLLCSGQRGVKDKLQDLKEARDTLIRCIEMLERE